MTHMPAVFAKGQNVMTSSLNVAAVFEKEHRNVLRDIRNLECSEEFTRLNFEPSEYVDTTGRTLPAYEMTKNGFTFLAMGFTGAKAAAFKEAYIGAFDRMALALAGRAAGRIDAQDPEHEAFGGGPDPVLVLGYSESRLRAVSSSTAMVHRLYGAKAARNFWKDTGMPDYSAPDAAAGHDLIIDQFIAARVRRAPGERVQAIHMYQAYCAWCADVGFTPRKNSRFGIDMGRQFGKAKCGAKFYMDVALA